MLRDTADISSQPATADGLPSAGSYTWLDEPWRISMGKSGKARLNVKTPDANHHDLCNICTYAPECMHRGTAVHPKVFCELFDVDVKAFDPSEDGDSPLASDSEPIGLTGGLCCNCENRVDCSIRPSSGNVWRCEEYR